jgi:hypothetical protein
MTAIRSPPPVNPSLSDMTIIMVKRLTTNSPQSTAPIIKIQARELLFIFANDSRFEMQTLSSGYLSCHPTFGIQNSWKRKQWALASEQRVVI